MAPAHCCGLVVSTSVVYISFFITINETDRQYDGQTFKQTPSQTKRQADRIFTADTTTKKVMCLQLDCLWCKYSIQGTYSIKI